MDGEEADHLCHIHECVNPDHFKEATRAENNGRQRNRTDFAKRNGKAKRDDIPF